MTSQPTLSPAQQLHERGVSRVLRPDDPDYSTALSCFNTRVDHRPDVVVEARNEDDVRAAVAVAAETGLPAVPIGRGHGFDRAMDGGIAVTTAAMARVSVDAGARTAVVGAGATWSQVLEAAAPHGLAPLAGSAPHVGVIGYLLGGGLGPVARTYGFAADHVRDLRVVTGLGEALTASAVENPDLFWALRGGKGGLGIVTQATIDLLPIATLHAGGIFYDAEDAHAAVHGFVDWTAGLPASVSTSLALLRLPPLPELPEPLRGRFVVHVRVAVVDTPAERALELVAPLRDAADPILDSFAEMPYAALGSIHADPTAPMPVVEGGCLLRTFDHAAADALLAAAGPAADVPLAAVELRLLGGAIATAPASPNAAGGRDAGFGLHVVAAPVPELDAVLPGAVQHVLTSMAPWATGGVLANFCGNANDPDDLQTAWPEAVRARLRAIRAQHDPKSVFPYRGHGG